MFFSIFVQMLKKKFFRLQITFMADYVKVDESSEVYQSMTAPLQSQDRLINPSKIPFLRQILRSCISEAEAAHYLLEAKG